jgi:NAD(P)-dependent dehydrogenase (short-subunit alcohol dehydrogenase family)
MVNISTIRKSNAQIDSSSTPRVAVFVGGTAGIGKLTLTEIVALGTSFKAYVIGRKGSKESFTLVRDELQQANPNAKIIWIDGEVSLLSEVKRICSHIKTLEGSVDLLFMTAGYAPLGGRQSMCKPCCSQCFIFNANTIIKTRPKA